MPQEFFGSQSERKSVEILFRVCCLNQTIAWENAKLPNGSRLEPSTSHIPQSLKVTGVVCPVRAVTTGNLAVSVRFGEPSYSTGLDCTKGSLGFSQGQQAMKILCRIVDPSRILFFQAGRKRAVFADCFPLYLAEYIIPVSALCRSTLHYQCITRLSIITQ